MRHKRLITVSTILVALTVVILVSLPLATRHYLQQWLRDQGASQATVEDIDFNPFTGRAAIIGLVADGTDGARLSVKTARVDVRWWPLTSRRIYIESVELTGVHADVEQDTDGFLKLGGLELPPIAGDDPEAEAPPGEPWGFGSERLDIRDSLITFTDQRITSRVAINHLRLGEQFTWRPEQPLELQLQAAVNDAPLSLSGTALPWDGEPQLVANLVLQELQLEPFGTLVSLFTPLELLGGSIATELDITARYQRDAIALNINGPLTITELNAQTAEAELAFDSLRWRGRVELKPDNKGNNAISGEISLQGSAIELDHRALELPLVRLTELAVDGIEVADIEQINLSGMTLRGLALLGAPDSQSSEHNGQSAGQNTGQNTGQTDVKPEPTVIVEQITLDRAVLQGNALDAETMQLTNPHINLVRLPSGKIDRITQLQEVLQQSTAPVAPVAAAISATQPTDQNRVPTTATESATPEYSGSKTAEPFTVNLAQLKVDAERWLSFVDQAVTPQMTFSLSRLQLQIDQLSSGASQPVKVTLATGNESMSLTATGTVTPPQPTLAANLEVKLTGLELPPFSPYLPGYDLFSGRFSTDSQLVINGDQLDANNELLIEKLKITTRKPVTETDAKGGLPLNLALDMLRNSKDEIRLTVPVKGSLDDPDLGLNDVIRVASQKALQKAATSYALKALQPFGTLLVVGDLAGKATRPRFAPVEMVAGTTTLVPDQQQYLDKVADLLQKRPGLSLTLCGVATPADQSPMGATGQGKPEDASTGSGPASSSTPALVALDEHLLRTLAEQRTAAIITLLEERGVSRERLFTCREQVEQDAAANPRVEVFL